MGLGDFWNKDDTNKILDWYGTTVKKATSERDQYGDGIAPTYAATVGIAGSTCFDSEDCGSGFACIGGQCALVDPNRPDATGGGSTAGCGGTGGSGGAPGGGGGPCEAGTGGGGGAGGSGCTKTGAGDCGSSSGGGGGGGGGGADDCCGDTRCCRAGGCSCGPCPPPNNCSQYCAAEKSSTGDSGAGCGGDQECDECSECKQGGPDDDDQADFKCRPRDGGPCYCPNGAKCAQCESCNENGQCQGDDSRCLECCTCGGPCPCGKFAQVKTCVPYSSGTVPWEDTCMAKCRALISKACDEICPPLPPNPELRDCNSNDECGDCEICDAAGECVPDPGCCNGDDNIYVKYKRTYKLFSSSIVSFSWGSTCDDNPPGYFDDGTPCVSKCRSSGEGSNQITREYCFKKSDKVEIGAAGNTFIGFPDLGCCETSPSTTYSLYVNGSAIGGEDITINGGSTAFGGGQQNNCYSGGYHSFYATGAKCGTCPD